MEAGENTTERKMSERQRMRVDFEEAERKEERRWHNDTAELTERRQVSWRVMWKRKVGNQLQRWNILWKTPQSCLHLSVTEYIYPDSEGRQAEWRQTAAHLTFEVIDALARLQDGHLHILRGLFGMDRLLLQWDKREEEENKTRDPAWFYRPTHKPTMLSGRVWKNLVNSMVLDFPITFVTHCVLNQVFQRAIFLNLN